MKKEELYFFSKVGAFDFCINVRKGGGGAWVRYNFWSLRLRKYTVIIQMDNIYA